MNDAAPRNAGATGVLAALDRQPPDPLLALIGAFRADPRPDKIDVGVGVYRDAAGETPVLRAVKAAEARLLAGQATKAYLGPEGDIGFVDAIRPIALGEAARDPRLCGIQTPGGTGALRLAAELVARARPDARVWVGLPSWPNHLPILAAAGLATRTYPWFDAATQTVSFDAMMDALEQAPAGDVVLLQACCHNPTGADLDPGQWAAVAALVARRGLLPMIDLAYQGLGRGLEEDAAGTRAVFAQVGEMLLAYSCDKNFGLYRERTGALLALSETAAAASVTMSNLLALARANWSMPPDHGAAVARIVLEDAALTADWRAELAAMCARIQTVRARLAAGGGVLGALAGQQGMFSLLPLTRPQIDRLRDARGIYMAGSGRINVAGLTETTAPMFLAAVQAEMG